MVTEIELQFPPSKYTAYARVENIPDKGHIIRVQREDLVGSGYARDWNPEHVLGTWRVRNVLHDSVGRWDDASTGITLLLEKFDGEW